METITNIEKGIESVYHWNHSDTCRTCLGKMPFGKVSIFHKMPFNITSSPSSTHEFRILEMISICCGNINVNSKY